MTLLLGHESTQQPAVNLDKSCVAAGGHDQLECLKVLLPRRGDLQKSDPLLQQILLAACIGGHSDVVKYLVTNLGVDVSSEPIIVGESKPLHEYILDAYDQSFTDLGVNVNTKPIIVGRRKALRKHVGDDYDQSSEDDGDEDIAARDSEDSKKNDNEHLTTSPLQATLRVFVKRGPLDELMTLRCTSIIKCLLDHGADPNQLAGQHAYPIQMAAMFCPDIVVGLLIDAGAEVKSIHKGESVLTAAIGRELQSASIVRRLLEAGAAFPPEDDAASKLIIKRLLNFFVGGSERNYRFDSDVSHGRFLLAPSLAYVFEEGPGAVLEQVIRQYPQSRTEGPGYHLILQMVSFLGKQDYVKLLLSGGTDPDGSGYYYGTPLQAAARTGQYEIVQILLQYGSNVNALEGLWQTPLRAAIMSETSSVVQVVISHGADIDLKYEIQGRYDDNWEEGSANALQLAMRDGNVEIVEALLAAGADPNEDTSYVLHPLITCCQQGRVDIAHLLLQSGAHVNVSRKKMRQCISIAAEDASPLHAAVSGGHVQLVELLLHSGADVNKEVKDRNGWTPLLTAIQEKSHGIIRMLLDAGAEVNHISETGTALLWAVRVGDINIVRMLLAAGAIVSKSAVMHELPGQNDGSQRHEALGAGDPVLNTAQPVQPNCLGEACLEGDPEIVELLIENIYRSDVQPENIIDEARDAVVRRKQQLSEVVLSLVLEYLPPSPKLPNQLSHS